VDNFSVSFIYTCLHDQNYSSTWISEFANLNLLLVFDNQLILL